MRAGAYKGLRTGAQLNMESDNGSTLGLAIVCIAIIQPKAIPSTYPGSEGVGISQSEAGPPL